MISAAGDIVKLLMATGLVGAEDRGSGLSVAAEAVGVGESKTRCDDCQMSYEGSEWGKGLLRECVRFHTLP